MPRYNTSLANNSITGSTTISSPFQGAFTQLTGTAPYTVILPSPVAFPGSNQTFYNATSGTVTLSTPSGTFTGTGGTGTSTVSCFAGNVVSVTSDGTNYIVISEDGSPLIATTGNFSSNVDIAGTLTVQPTGTVSISPSVAGVINNVSIGASTRSSGAFTTLAANSQVSFTGNISSSSTSTGTVVITGGLGVSGAINATSVSASLTGTIQTAAQPNITSVGNLTTTGLTVNNNSIIANTTSINPDSFTNSVVAGGISFTSGWGVGSGIGGNAGGTGKSWGMGHNGTNFYIGMSNGSANNTQQTYIQLLPNRNLALVETSGNVGIGLTTPSAKLHIYNRADGNAAPGTPEIRIEHQDINAIGTAGTNGGILSFYNIQRDNTGWPGDRRWGQIDFYPSQPTAGVAQIGARILSAADGSIGGTDTSSYISFQTTSVSTLNERLRIGASGAITAYGNYRSTPTSTSGAFILGSDSDGAGLFRDNTYDVVLKQDNASGNGLYLAGAGNVYIGIDSNNNETDRKFIVGNNSVKPTNELFSVNESGLTYSAGGHAIADSYSYQQSGNFSAGTWYNITNTGIMTMAGVYICMIYTDTYASGGAIYYCTTATVPFYWWGVSGSNNSTSFDLPVSYGTGHAFNGQNPPTIRLQQEFGVNGARTYIQFNPNVNLTGINGTGGKNLIFSFKRIG